MIFRDCKSKLMNNPVRPQSFYMLIVGFMYVVLGFSIGINAYFIPFVQEAFLINTATSYLIMTATFSSYIFFGVPSGYIIKAIGYKASIVVSFILIAIGFSLIGLSASLINFTLFLLALFVIGMGQTLLTGAINSYITLLGAAESAAKRISFMGIADKMALAGASFILGGFLDLQDVQLSDAIVPFYIIAILLLILGFVIYYSPLPELTAVGEIPNVDEEVYANKKQSIWQIPHVILGTIAIFFDVGVEIIALGSINDYAKVLGKSNPENYVWLTTFGMVIGYIVGILFIPKKLSQRIALIGCTLLGILTIIILLVVPKTLSIYMVACLGLANSLLWPTIFPLALADLGKFTKQGASILVMGIIGGAILPLAFGHLADLWGHQRAYVVCLPAYVYILYYALRGSQLRIYKEVV